ncbi:GroES-like protein [Xylariomycetidae sp. FL0641]|nr:GroES-like protein [Xylariomycetidae sp. FL0641]
MAGPEIPKEMQALQLVQFNAPYELRTVPVPKPGPHDLLVKVAVASYCHTDGMVASGVFGSALPQTMSHEGAGTVVAVGAEASGFEVGDRVMVGLPMHPCGACHDCMGPHESHRQYCRHASGHVGVMGAHGCAAEYVICDARSTTPMPDAVSFLSAAPLACAGRTVWRAVQQTGATAGEWIALVGAGGGLGHLGVQFAKAKGLEVLGVDAREAGLATARQAGADVVVDARKPRADVVGEVQAVTAGDGVAAAVVLSDHADAAGLAAACTAMHGTVVQVAQPENVVVPFREFVFRDIRFCGSLLCSPDESRAMLAFIADHGVQVKTNVFRGLDKIEELLQLVHSGKLQGKAVMVVDEAQIEEEKRRGAKY